MPPESKQGVKIWGMQHRWLYTF